MAKIGQATYEILKRDPRVRILQDGETDATASKAAVDAAVAAAGRAAARVAEVEAENAGLKEANEALTARLAELEGLAPEEHKAAKHHEGKGGKKS
jgi:hypothetical protein